MLVIMLVLFSTSIWILFPWPSMPFQLYLVWEKKRYERYHQLRPLAGQPTLTITQGTTNHSYRYLPHLTLMDYIHEFAEQQTTMACSETALEKYTLMEKGMEYVFRRSATLEEEKIGPNSQFYCKNRWWWMYLIISFFFFFYLLRLRMIPAVLININQYQFIPFLALFISHNLPTNHSMIAKAALIPRELSQTIPSIHSQSTDMDISLQSWNSNILLSHSWTLHQERAWFATNKGYMEFC